ncbi:Mu transposase C-terminal domain-containing protein [Desulfobulbus sp.]|uniref:Mu transposase C-terminal domain-containing protein n=1 Tax=Desulfobulbus sp. TaxID=895 RepID=UPI00286F61C8|nr:Mu transposase C-terminal domain-containing protein [Desulfobulbus sp.]
MKGTVTAREIAEATGLSKRAVQLNLDGLGKVFVWKKGPTGPEKHYPATLLPEEYRVAVATARVAAGYAEPDGIAEAIGAEAAREIKAARAEEKERDLIAKEQNQMAFDQLPEQRRQEAAARHELLELCDGFVQAAGFGIPRYAQRSKKADQAFVAAYNSGKIKVPENVRQIIGDTTSYSTLRRIAEAYSRYGLPGLAFAYHNPKRGQTALTTEQQDMVINAMCLNPNTSSVNIRRILIGKFGREIPSSAAIGRFRANWIKNNENLWLYYTNPDEWKNKKALSFGSASERVERLNQLWEADSTPADVMLADGRHSIIGVIDVYTRRLRFLVSKTSKAASVVALLRHCIIEWGVPETLKIDNGQDYRSAHVARVLDSLEVEREYCTPFQGQEKPHIERAFRTFLHGLVELMPNFIGHNVPERKAIEARRSFADRVMNKDSAPVEVNMTAEALQKFCNEWTEFVYQHDPHSGLDGKKPIDMVRSWQHPIRRITSDLRVLDMLLMPAPKDGGRRTIQKKGIDVEGRFYKSDAFAEHVGKKALVLLDPADMGTAFVYLYGERGERSFLCAAIDPQWYGIDSARFATASRKHQDKIMREEVKKLRKAVKQEATREAYKEYVNFRKSEVAGLIEFPRKAEEYTTPMLAEAAKAVAAVDRTRGRQDEMAQKLRDVEIVLTEPAPPTPAKEQKVVKLITCKSDRYLDILTSVRKERRPLTKWEYDFLTDFYTNDATGKGYLLLEGDLREKYGVAGADIAEG